MSDKLDIDLDFGDEFEEEEVEDSLQEEVKEEEVQEEEVAEESKKVDFMKLLNKKNVKAVNADEEYELYLLIDNKANQIGGWLNKLGIYPTYISEDIDDFAGMIEMAYEKCIVMIVDTGVGGFNSMENATKLINLLGMDVFEDKHFYMLYSDDTIRVDARAKLGKTNIKWIQYKGSKDIYNLIKQNHMKLIDGEPYDYKVYDMDCLEFKGESLDSEGDEWTYQCEENEEVESLYGLFGGEEKDKESIEGYKIVV